MPNLFKSKPWGIVKPPLGVQINPSHPLAQGLAAYWLFNEGGGNNVYDCTGNPNVGTQTNLTAPFWQPGNFGTAIQFNGNSGGSGYINVPAATEITPAGNYSVGAWINTSYGGNEQEIITKFTVGPYSGFLLSLGNGLTPAGTPCFWVGDLGSGWFTGTGTINDGKWHFIVGTVKGTTISIYVDGILNASGTRTPTFESGAGQPLNIGRRSDTGAYFGGFIGQAFLYQRALSATEIQQLYTDPFCFMQPARGQLLSFPGSGGNVYYETLSESVVGTDAETCVVTFNPAYSDSIIATDSESASAIFGAAYADSIVATDSESAAAIFRPAYSDSVVGTDSYGASGTYNPAYKEPVVLTENEAAAATFITTLSEANVLTDGYIGGLLFNAAISESIVGTDSETAAIIFNPIYSDSIVATDSQAAIATFRPAYSEAVVLTDAESAAAIINTTISEANVLTDSYAPGLIIRLSIAESIAATDSIVAALLAKATIIESIQALDAYGVSSDFIEAISEAMTATDSYVIITPGTTPENRIYIVYEDFPRTFRVAATPRKFIAQPYDTPYWPITE